ncbi:MAG: hypothetical protein IT317_06445 [Anaerolineales bacterium]|nr:hypothetical protein [Anaerolineales bacterium]
MSNRRRPDLSHVDSAVLAYIEALEAELAERAPAPPTTEPAAAAAPGPSEPPTTLNVVTISRAALAKRTPRHRYDRQRRGGTGVVDWEGSGSDSPACVAVLDVAHDLIVITNHGRAFHIAVDHIAEAPVRSRGQPLLLGANLHPDEHVAAALPAGRGTNIALLTERGYVRTLPAHVVGQAMPPGTTVLRATDYGPVSAACWTEGAGDLFVASRRGLAIRFPERALPVPGGLGLRLEAGDVAVAIEAVQPPDGEALFLLGADGRGTVRLMAGFAANKAPGGGGKLALKTYQLIGVIAVGVTDDLFIVSRLGKVIRFRAGEVPPKESVVQGVNCMALRGDACAALTATPMPMPLPGS